MRSADSSRRREAHQRPRALGCRCTSRGLAAGSGGGGGTAGCSRNATADPAAGSAVDSGGVRASDATGSTTSAGRGPTEGASFTATSRPQAFTAAPRRADSSPETTPWRRWSSRNALMTARDSSPRSTAGVRDCSGRAATSCTHSLHRPSHQRTLLGFSGSGYHPAVGGGTAAVDCMLSGGSHRAPSQNRQRPVRSGSGYQPGDGLTVGIRSGEADLP